jgi:hypothetical protein
VSFADGLAQATAASVCNWLNTGGSAVAATFIGAGTFFPPTSVASRGLALGLLALDYGCSLNTNNRVPGGGRIEGCTKAASGVFQVFPLFSDGHFNPVPIGFIQVKELRNFRTTSTGGFEAEFFGAGYDNNFYWQRYDSGGPANGIVGWKTVPYGAMTCAGDAPVFDIPAPLPQQNFTTNEGCQLHVDFESWLMGPDGKVKPVVKISPVASQLASGGVIGGCNFAPIVYVGGGGGEPPWYAPWNPFAPGPDGKPWWLQLLEAGATAALEAVLVKILEDLMAPTLPEVTYTLSSVCEVDAEGLPTQRFVERTIPAGKGLPAIAQRIDMLQFIAQGLKDFKQPTCPREDTRPRFTGEEVTVRFESKEPSPYSAMRLRKNLRYRRQNGTDLTYHAQAWWNYEWRSGSCQVISTGLSWGRPQVWASTEAEGMRVIRWAAELAGVNLNDPKHKWVVNWSTDPRTGVAAEMRTKLLADGQPWVTERLGPAGPPMVADLLLPDP